MNIIAIDRQTAQVEKIFDDDPTFLVFVPELDRFVGSEFLTETPDGWTVETVQMEKELGWSVEPTDD